MSVILAATRQWSLPPGFGLITVMLDADETCTIPSVLAHRLRRTGNIVTGTESAWHLLRFLGESVFSKEQLTQSWFTYSRLPHHMPLISSDEWHAWFQAYPDMFWEPIGAPQTVRHIPALQEVLDGIPIVSSESFEEMFRTASLRRLHTVLIGDDPGPHVYRHRLATSPALFHIAAWGRYVDPWYGMEEEDMYYTFLTSEYEAWKSLWSMWNRTGW